MLTRCPYRLSTSESQKRSSISPGNNSRINHRTDAVDMVETAGAIAAVVVVVEAGVVAEAVVVPLGYRGGR